MEEYDIRLSKIVPGVVIAVLSVAGCQQSEGAAPVPAAAEVVTQAAPEPQLEAKAAEPKVKAAALTLVDPSQVCMVNNQYMGKPQIPVEVSGKTYYGCCEMCKGKLLGEESARTAVDPTSKRPVDKSVAVIAKNENGDVFYFENDANFAAYLQSIGS